MPHSCRVCGRYTLAGDWHEFTREFDLEEVPDLVPRFNIAPSYGSGVEAPIVLAGRELAPARFWYIPAWWNEPLKKLPTSFNARCETAMRSSFFRTAERCLVPTTGFRVFVGPARHKRAYQFELRRPGEESPHFFAFGGLAGVWQEPRTGEVVRSFAILTAGPSEEMRDFHDRAPLVISREEYASWLNPSIPYDEALERAVRESKERTFSHYECSTYGNNSHHEGPACIEPIAQQKCLRD